MNGEYNILSVLSSYRRQVSGNIAYFVRNIYPLLTMSLPLATEPAPSKRPLILAGILIAFSIFLLGSTVLTLLLKPVYLSDENILLITRIFFWICLLVMVAYAVRAEKQPFLLWPEKKYPFGTFLISIIAILSILLAAMTILSQVEMAFGVEKKSANLNKMEVVLKRNQWLLVFTCLTAGVTEELIFRGYLIPRLQLFFKGPYPALIISSVFFGLAHIGYGSIHQVIGPVFIGFIFALYYKKYRNIKVLILCHFLWDYLILFAMTR